MASKPAIAAVSASPPTGTISPPSHRNRVSRVVGDRALKIAFLTPEWPAATAANGIVTYVDSISAGLRRQGHTVCILSGHSNDTASYPDVYPVARVERSALGKIRHGLTFLINPPEAMRQRYGRA